MNKQLFKMGFNIVLIFSLAVLCVSVMPKYEKQVSAFSSGVAKLSAPSVMLDNANTIFSYYNNENEEDNSTVPVRKTKQVMKAISAEDSKDYTDITATPPDVLKLMENAQKNYNSNTQKGKTTEEPYLGGGTVISFNGTQIQSKIPSDFYKPDIEALLKKGAELKIKDKSVPTILIYHSHTTEAYALLDKGFYISSDARSRDANRSVVRVGKEIATQLEKQGFKVIHDTVIHDTDYNSSYDESRKSVEKYLEQYPSIDVTIDVHRDDITYKNKTKVKPTAVVAKKKCARMMIISGCEYGMVKNFPDWEYNLRFSLAVQQKMNELYKGVMRPILFSQRRYNMFETHNSFLLEVGTDANTLEEACYSGRMFGDALGKLLNERYVKN